MLDKYIVRCKMRFQNIFFLSSVIDDEAVLMQFLQEHSKYDNSWNVGNGKINIKK